MVIGRVKDNKLTTEVVLPDHPTVRPVYVGQPLDVGGLGTDFRPSQLVLAGYVGCVSVNVRAYLEEDNVPYEDVIVSADIDSSEPGLSKIYTQVDIIADIPQAQKDKYIEMAAGCHVHRILANQKVFLPFSARDNPVDGCGENGCRIDHDACECE